MSVSEICAVTGALLSLVAVAGIVFLIHDALRPPRVGAHFRRGPVARFVSP